MSPPAYGEILFYSDFVVGYPNREAEERMRRFAERGHRVVYVEQLGIRNPRLRHLARVAATIANRRSGEGTTAALDVVSPRLLPPRGAPLLGGFNERWLARQLDRTLSEPAEAVVWIRFPTPELLRFLERGRHKLVVYEQVDDHLHTPGMTPRLRKRFLAAERRVLEQAGLVLASSELIRARLAALHPNVVLAPAAAVDVETFAAASAHTDPRPRTAICAGGLDFRCDVELLAAVAGLLSDWELILAGWSEPGVADRLAPLPNVTLTGLLPPAEIPALLASAAACLVPFRRNAFNDTLFPVKVVEYLAAGRPVVGTPIDAIRRFGDVTYSGDTPEEFAAAITRAAAEDSAELRAKRIARAAPHSWEARIEQLELEIQRALDPRSPY